jgi:hypothetical protein
MASFEQSLDSGTVRNSENNNDDFLECVDARRRGPTRCPGLRHFGEGSNNCLNKGLELCYPVGNESVGLSCYEMGL